jgi:EmrB/QacA subfamily drug resistance transporter
LGGKVAGPLTGASASGGWALATLSLATLLSSLGTSIANVALPTLAEAFGASFQQVQWIVLAYLLAITSLIVSVGKLGDMIGRGRLLMAGLLLFTLASVVCAVAPTLGFLIGARAVQGFGAAIMMALSMALVGGIVPREKTGHAMGLLGTMSAVGTSLGPSLGGVLIAAVGGPGIVLVSVPLGAIGMALVHRHIPSDGRSGQAAISDFDMLGTALLVLALVAYALAMTVGRGHFGSANLLLLAAAIITTGLFLVVESKARSPLIRLRMFEDPILSAGLAMSLLVMTVMMATLVVGPFYLSNALHLDPLRVGAVMSVGPLVAAFAGVPAGKLVDRLGEDSMTLLGLFLNAAGCVLLAALPTRFGLLAYIGAVATLTTGYAMFQAANNTAVMKNVGPDQRGLVSGLLNLSRNLGLVTGAAFMGAIFALAAGASNVSRANAEATALGMRVTFATGALLIAAAIAIVGARLLPARRVAPGA